MAYRADYRGIGEMLCAPWMVANMRRRAEAVAERARVTAPRGRTERYADSFEVSSGIREGKTRRAFGRVRSPMPYAAHVEFGTEETTAHRTLGRALSAAKG